MTDLVTWLRAQLDDDARVARAAGEVCGCCLPAREWQFADDEHDGRIVTVDDPHPDVRRRIGRRWNKSYGDMFAARHIARWDPARVLAEVDAKRSILRLHENAAAALRAGSISAHNRAQDKGADDVLDEAVRALALPYADRPGYLEQWRPDLARA